MTRLEELKGRLAEITDEQTAILDEGDEKHGGELTEALEQQFQMLDKEKAAATESIKRLEASAKRREELQARQAALGKVTPKRADAAPRVVKEAHEDDPKHGFRSHKDFLEAVMSAGRSGNRMIDDRLRPLAAAGSDEQGIYSDSLGGFFVPEGFMPGPLALMPEMDPTAGRVTNVPMGSPVVRLNARTDKNHTSSVSGGLQFYRRAETDTVSATQAVFEQVKLDATMLMGVSYITEELLEASPQSFAAIVSGGFAQQRGVHLLNEKLRGTGAGEPEGILNAAATVSVAKETGQAAATIVGANVLKMRSRCWMYGNAIWLANHDVIPQLATAHLSLTNSDAPVFVPGNGADVPDTLMGRPIYFSEYCATLGTVGDLILGVWSEYLWGTYTGPRSAESMHVRFLNHERTFKFYEQNDGRVWWRSALTPNKSSSTLSPFVTLATRA